VIFLDEIGEASQKFQAALLRVIDNREVQRVGDPHIRMLTGLKKVVCATAKDLEEEMKAKTFREDLFHRISGLTIYCEPLEKRPEDIRLLVRHFLATDPELQQSGPFSEYAVDYWITWVYLAERYAEALISGETEPQSMEIPPLKGHIRGLREHVRRAVLEDKLTKYEEAPFEDRWGALNYTKEEIERYDWTIALDGCPLQKDAGRLMGIDDKKKVSKILEPLGLMKKQRKKQGPQA